MTNKTVGSTGSGTTMLTLASPNDASRALGEFLRLMRNRAVPPAGATMKRRRARGLRREEVAVRAGISVTWYTWLEQGRSVRVSQSTVRAIGAALQLSPVQLTHLAMLAELVSNAQHSPLTTHLPHCVAELVDRLHPHAAYAINGMWDVLHANSAAIELLGKFQSNDVTGNVLRRLFLDAHWREGFEPWSEVAESAVAQFRASTSARTNENHFIEFIAQLQRDSEIFKEMWARHELSDPPSHVKIFNHATMGRVRLAYNSVTPDDAPADVRIVLYMHE